MYLEMDVLCSIVVNFSLSILCMFYLICAYCLDIVSFFNISRCLLVCHMNSSLTFINLIFIDFVVLTAQAGQHLGIASVSSIWYSYWLNWNYSDTVTLWPVICTDTVIDLRSFHLWNCSDSYWLACHWHCSSIGNNLLVTDPVLISFWSACHRHNSDVVFWGVCHCAIDSCFDLL